MFGLKPSFGSSLGAIASLAIALPATGQTPLPACQPPRPDEFLLLVQLAAESDRDKLRLALPAEAEWTACTYQGNTVARLAGFPNLEIANNWGRYLVEIAGLSATVARQPRAASSAATLESPPSRSAPPAAPSSSSTFVEREPVQPPRAQQPPAPIAPPTPAPAAPPTVPDRYAPRPLGTGYAVLVDYFHRPELARTVQQVVGEEIGLAAYFTRPYLLAGHTSDAATAQTLLRQLSDRGLAAFVTDSRQVMLLAPRLSLP